MNRRPIAAATLAIAVTWAGTACACALPVAEASSAHDHHAHHGMDDPSPHAACPHSDCQGGCAIDASSPKTTAIDPSKTSLDDYVATAEPAFGSFAARVQSAHHPPWSTPRPVDSPVRRFDTLLN